MLCIYSKVLNLIALLIISQGTGSTAHAQVDWLPGLRPQGPKTSPRQIKDPEHWMAVVGDSGATGAASDPRLSANVLTLLGRMGAIGLQEGISYHPATRG